MSRTCCRASRACMPVPSSSSGDHSCTELLACSLSWLIASVCLPTAPPFVAVWQAHKGVKCAPQPSARRVCVQRRSVCAAGCLHSCGAVESIAVRCRRGGCCSAISRQLVSECASFRLGHWGCGRSSVWWKSARPATASVSSTPRRQLLDSRAVTRSVAMSCRSRVPCRHGRQLHEAGALSVGRRRLCPRASDRRL
jgi:hypothetical protein